MNTELASEQIPVEARPMKKKMGRPPENGVGRIKMSGTWIGLETKLLLTQWSELYGVPPGKAIDAMLQHVKNDPSFRLKLPKRKLRE